MSKKLTRNHGCSSSQYGAYLEVPQYWKSRHSIDLGCSSDSSSSSSIMTSRRPRPQPLILTSGSGGSGGGSIGASVQDPVLRKPASMASMGGDAGSGEPLPGGMDSLAPNRESNSSLNRNSTGPIDVDEVERQLKAQQDLEEGQRSKLIEFVSQKKKVELEELCNEQFTPLEELGKGNGGVVSRVQHRPTNLIMARKNIHLDINQAVRQQIIRELQVLHDCNSPYIVGYYGAFFHGNNISICMEYMDGGSLDMVLRIAGRLPEPIVSRITWAVLKGLKYLRESLHIIHRDVKPSNILVNLEGEVKLCDFGVSGKLIDSIACSFVGTRSYMAPERINGLEYNIRSDVWSLGLSLIELASGRYPIPDADTEDFLTVFQADRDANIHQHSTAATQGLHLPALKSRGGGSLAIFELLSYIVDNPPPSVPDFCFSPDFPDFVDNCLRKDPNSRLSLDELLNHSLVCNNGAGQHYALDIQMANYLRVIVRDRSS